MSSPNPNLQSPSPLTSRVPLAPPVLHRLLWLHAHLLKWIWLGLYAVGLALMLYLIAMGSQYHIELTNMLPQSFIGLTGCFLVVAICLLYAGEKEEHLDEFTLHRGWNLYLIHASKISLSLFLYIALIAALYLSRTILTTVLRIKLNTTFTDLELAYTFYLPTLLLAWSFLSNQFSKTVLNAIGLTFAGIILQAIIVGLTTSGFQFIPMITINAILITMILLATNTRTASLLQSAAQNIASTLQIPSASASLTKTEHLSRNKSRQFHLNWLHTHERRLTWTTGIAIVLFSLAFFPLVAFGLHDGPFPLLFCLVIPAFCCAAPLLTFQPEHAQSNYHFWNDRGIPWQSILRSRLLGFLIPHLTIITLSLASLMIGFLLIIPFGPNPNFKFPDLQLEFRRIAERDPQFFPTLWLALTILLPIATITAFFYSWMFRSPLVAFVIQLLTLIALFAYAAATYIGLDIPLWLTLYPLAAVILYLTVSRYPIRFQPEIPTSLYRTNTLAIIATFLASLTATAIYRVYQVPRASTLVPEVDNLIYMPFRPDRYFFERPNITTPLPENTFSTKFYQTLKDIESTYRSRQVYDSKYARHLIATFGWNYIEPSLQLWTSEHSSQANSLKSLLISTPCSQLFLSPEDQFKYNLSIETPFLLLIYSAKYHESKNDLITAADFYQAANRFCELFCSHGNTMSSGFRGRLILNLVSWATHPDQSSDTLNDKLLDLISPPSDALTGKQKIDRAYQQAHDFYIKNSPSHILLLEQRSDAFRPHLYLWHLPTERWRFERFLNLWHQQNLLEECLAENAYYTNPPKYLPQLISWFEFRDFVLEKGLQLEEIRNLTTLAYEQSSLKWNDSELSSIENSIEFRQLAFASLFMTISQQQTGHLAQSPAQAFQTLKTKSTFSSTVLNKIEFELHYYDYAIEHNGPNPVNTQPGGSERHNDYPSIGQTLIAKNNPGFKTFTRSLPPNSPTEYVRCQSTYIILPDLKSRPPIPDYYALETLTPEQLLNHFRTLAGIQQSPPPPPLPESTTPGLDN